MSRIRYDTVINADDKIQNESKYMQTVESRALRVTWRRRKTQLLRNHRTHLETSISYDIYLHVVDVIAIEMFIITAVDYVHVHVDLHVHQYREQFTVTYVRENNSDVYV